MCALEERLTELKKLCQKENVSEHEFYKLAHPLAEEQYEPLREFLIELLDSPNNLIRLQAVHLLSTHWHEKQDIGEKFIELLLNDPYYEVRMLSASGLGHIKYTKAQKVLNRVADNPIEEDCVRSACIYSINVFEGTPRWQITREGIDAEMKARLG